MRLCCYGLHCSTVSDWLLVLLGLGKMSEIGKGLGEVYQGKLIRDRVW